MDSLSESMTKHLCPTCSGICDKGIVITQTEDMLQLYCPGYKSSREIIKKLAYQDDKANITAHKGKALMDLNI